VFHTRRFLLMLDHCHAFLQGFSHFSCSTADYTILIFIRLFQGAATSLKSYISAGLVQSTKTERRGEIVFYPAGKAFSDPAMITERYEEATRGP
jgi:hypothetical protein